jgi:16S rRNA (cytidine1402-2'-O)-methyltransferase
MTDGILYVVATPIGNMEDITLRALRVLADCDFVAAEDTRRTRALLSRHGLARPLVALHEHNEERQAPALVKRLAAGESAALVSDAGTPLLSDPGYRLVGMAIESGIQVIPIPGPSSVTAALSVSGLPTDRFSFEGFIPARKAARRRYLEQRVREPRTQLFFETGQRLAASLQDAASAFGPGRRAVLCREMTKQFETVLRGTLAELAGQVGDDPNQQKGEVVLLVAGHADSLDEDFAAALELAFALQEHVSSSQAARIAARIHSVPRRALYRALEEER